jgi:hypothetical protein
MRIDAAQRGMGIQGNTESARIEHLRYQKAVRNCWCVTEAAKTTPMIGG